MTTRAERRAIFARVPRELARAVRVEAARREVSMSRFVEGVLRRELGDRAEPIRCEHAGPLPRSES